MKIGILTYHAPCNFGANLQAYASQKYFSSLGHDTWIINFDMESDKCDKAAEGQVEAHRHFSQKVLRVTRVVNKHTLLDLVREMQFDAIGVGADAVWNKRVHDDLRVFFGDWLFKSDLKDKVKMFALSPAFMGQTYQDLPNRLKEDFKNALEQFVFLDTRDEWTAHVINKEIAGYELIKILNPDPVFLLDEFVDVEWRHPDFIQSKEYILYSLPKDFDKFLGSLKRMWLKKFMQLLHKKGYKLVEIPIPEGVSQLPSDYRVQYPIDPLQWYLWIKNARGYWGLRFHAVVSSISAGTPFFSLDTYGKIDTKWHKLLSYIGFHGRDSIINKSSKIRNLIQGSGLENHRINGTWFFTISPWKLFNILENTNKELICQFRVKNIEKFKSNMQEMIKKITAHE